MANNTIGSATVILSAESEKLIRGMKDAQDSVISFGKNIISAWVGVEGAMKAYDFVADQVMRIKEFAKRGADFADAQDRMARNLGISTNAMAAFSAMEAKADLEAGALATGLAKMQQTIVDASTAGSTGEKTLAKLGLRFSDLAGLGADEQFKIIADAISRVNSASERTSASVDLFGRAGKDLVGTLSQGRAAFDEAAAAAKTYGTVIDAATSARILKAEDLIKEMALKIKGYEQQAAGAMAESKAADAAYDAMKAKRSADMAHVAAESIGLGTRIMSVWNDMVENANFGVNAYGNNIRSLTKEQKTWETTVVSAAEQVKKAGEEAAAESAKQETAEAKAAEAARVRHVQEQAAIDARLAGIVRYLPMLKQWEESEAKAIAQMKSDGKKASDSYLGAMGVIEKFRDSIIKAKADAMDPNKQGFDFIRGQWEIEIKAAEEWAKRDPASDPRVTYLVAVRELEGETWRNMTADEIAAEAKRREDQASRWANPSMDPRLRHEERVSEMVKRDAERRAHDQEVATQNAHMAQLSMYSNFFSNLATLTEDASKQSIAAFYVNKAMQMAAAEVNAWLAYSQIIAAPVLGLGPIEATTMKQVMAGTALAAGQVAVAHIATARPSGRANGGSVSRNSVYQVNERGPELLSVGDRTYLMTGNRDGRVTANSGIRSGGNTSVVVHNYSSTPATTNETTNSDGSRQIEVIIGQVDRAIASGIRAGNNATAMAVQSTFGLNRSRGAY